MRTRLAGTVVLLAVSLCGCGGGDDGEPDDPPQAVPEDASQEQRDFARAAEEICVQALRAGQQVTQPTTAQEYVDGFRTTLRIGEMAAADLSALTPPAVDAEALQEGFLGPVNQQVEAFQAALPRVEAAASAPDPQAALSMIPDPGASITINIDYIRQYGMPTCARFAGG